MEALSGLQRVSREINATLDSGHILRLVLEEAMRLAQATRGALVRREVVGQALRPEVCVGYSEAEEARIQAVLRSPEEHLLLAAVLDTNETQVVADVMAEGNGGDVWSESRSVLITPIYYKEALAGLILLESAERDAFDRRVVEFVEGLSAQAAIAIGNAQRYQEQLERGDLLLRRADQLAKVLGVSRALRSDRPLEEILEEIAYAIQESVAFDLVLISVLEGDPLDQHWVAAAGIPIAEFERLREVRQPWSVVDDLMSEEFRISQSYYVPAERRSNLHDYVDVCIGDVDHAERRPGCWHPQDLLLVPLAGPSGGSQGLLSVGQPRDGRIPDLATVEVLEIFAGQAGLAIENARLIEALQLREALQVFIAENGHLIPALADFRAQIEPLQIHKSRNIQNRVVLINAIRS